MYKLYFNGQCIGKTNVLPIVSDNVMGYYVWAVDYYARAAWLSK